MVVFQFLLRVGRCVSVRWLREDARGIVRSLRLRSSCCTTPLVTVMVKSRALYHIHRGDLDHGRSHRREQFGLPRPIPMTTSMGAERLSVPHMRQGLCRGPHSSRFRLRAYSCHQCPAAHDKRHKRKISLVEDRWPYDRKFPENVRLSTGPNPVPTCNIVPTGDKWAPAFLAIVKMTQP